MRSAKQSDSPSGATRDVYPLRGRVHGPDLPDYSFRVLARAKRLLATNPHLAGEDPRVLFSRLVVPVAVVDYEGALTRAAMAVLLVAAVDRAEQADPFTGGEVA